VVVPAKKLAKVAQLPSESGVTPATLARETNGIDVPQSHGAALGRHCDERGCRPVCCPRLVRPRSHRGLRVYDGSNRVGVVQQAANPLAGRSKPASERAAASANFTLAFAACTAGFSASSHAPDARSCWAPEAPTGRLGWGALRGLDPAATLVRFSGLVRWRICIVAVRPDQDVVHEGERPSRCFALLEGFAIAFSGAGASARSPGQPSLASTLPRTSKVRGETGEARSKKRIWASQRQRKPIPLRSGSLSYTTLSRLESALPRLQLDLQILVLFPSAPE